VTAHDPAAAERFRREQPDLKVELVDNPEKLFDGADAVVLVTEWKQYLALDWAGLRPRMRVPVLIDGRNVLDRNAMEDAGYRYLRIP
jgi:UDPglucose 6-dehydrogenase